MRPRPSIQRILGSGDRAGYVGLKSRVKTRESQSVFLFPIDSDCDHSETWLANAHWHLIFCSRLVQRRSEIEIPDDSDNV